MKEAEIRKTVKALKNFYMDVLWFVLGGALFTLIWLAFDSSGTFWPKYIFLVWGISLIVSAYRKGIMEHFVSHFSFFNQEWEEEKVSEIIGHRQDQKRIHLNCRWKK